MKLNIQLDIIRINLTPKPPFLSSGKHYEYFTISNFLKSMELKYSFLREHVKKKSTLCLGRYHGILIIYNIDTEIKGFTKSLKCKAIGIEQHKRIPNTIPRSNFGQLSL